MNTKEFTKTLFEQTLLYFYKPFLQHINTLAIKYGQSVRVDDYGITQLDDWVKELRYFIQKVILPPLSTKEITAIYNAGFVCLDCDRFKYLFEGKVFIKKFNICTYLPEFENIFIRPADAEQISSLFYIVPVNVEPPITEIEMERLLNDKRFNDLFLNRLMANSNVFLLDIFSMNPDLLNQQRTTNLTPGDYEYFIASELKSLGFTARTTKASGDQGADVLAEKNGVSFAIQCKMYSKPVGNKAVQEANAGRDFYKKDYGVVVSNAKFTKSAQQAASACGVILLNDNMLDKLLKYTNKQPGT